MTDIKPCPFCGVLPDFPQVGDMHGTFFEFACDCGVASIDIQISDTMTIDERVDDKTDYKIDGYCYAEKYRQRAIDEATKEWNTRHVPEGFVLVPVEPTQDMLDASGCECGLIGHGAPEQRKQANNEHKAYDYKAMIGESDG